MADRRPVVRAPDDAWQRLGGLLQLRRAELGYRRRPAFTREHGINIRLVTDIENAYRPNTFLTPTLREIAQAYQVTYESLIAVLNKKADELVPAAPAVPGEPPGWTPPAGGAAYSADVRRRTDRIWERLRQLALRGIADPDGTQVFLRAAGDPPGYAGIGSPADARDWDGAGSRLDLPDRVWLIADLQRGDAARAAGSRSGASGALARRDARDAIA